MVDPFPPPLPASFQDPPHTNFPIAVTPPWSYLTNYLNELLLDVNRSFSKLWEHFYLFDKYTFCSQTPFAPPTLQPFCNSVSCCVLVAGGRGGGCSCLYMGHTTWEATHNLPLSPPHTIQHTLCL